MLRGTRPAAPTCRLGFGTNFRCGPRWCHHEPYGDATRSIKLLKFSVHICICLHSVCSKSFDKSNHSIGLQLSQDKRCWQLRVVNTNCSRSLQLLNWFLLVPGMSTTTTSLFAMPLATSVMCSVRLSRRFGGWIHMELTCTSEAWGSWWLVRLFFGVLVREPPSGDL